jgi:hypothetical protein
LINMNLHGDSLHLIAIARSHSFQIQSERFDVDLHQETRGSIIRN